MEAKCSCEKQSGVISIVGDSVQFKSAAASNNSGEHDDSTDAASSSSSSSLTVWSFPVTDVHQLLVSKKPPQTSAKIAFASSPASPKIIVFLNTEDRSKFVAIIEEAAASAAGKGSNAGQLQQQQDQRTGEVKKEDGADGGSSITTTATRRAWLQHDVASQEVFRLLSEVSAFSCNNNISVINVDGSNRAGAGPKQEEEKSSRERLDPKQQQQQQDSVVQVNNNSNSSDNNPATDAYEDDDALFLQILQEEERKYYAHPGRQEVGSSAVYDALNDLVDPVTHTFRPVSETTAASIFRQIPHLASVYTRLVHSAEDEMLFWVSVARRRLFFSRTNLDEQLDECGPTLCPIGTAKKAKNKKDGETEIGNIKEDEKGKTGDTADEADSGATPSKFALALLDDQSQRPHLRIGESHNYDELSSTNEKSLQPTSASSAASSSSALPPGAKISQHLGDQVAHQLNVASGLSVNLAHREQHAEEQHPRGGGGGGGGAKKMKDLSMMMMVDDGAATSSVLAPFDFFEDTTSFAQDESTLPRRRNRDDDNDDAEEDQQQRKNKAPTKAPPPGTRDVFSEISRKIIASSQTQTEGNSTTSATGEWVTFWVGGPPPHRSNGGLSGLVPSPTASRQRDDEADGGDVKPTVASTYARAAAFLCRVFWRKVRDVVALLKHNNNNEEGKKSQQQQRSKQKREAAVKRLQSIRQSLSKLMDQWKLNQQQQQQQQRREGSNAGEDEDAHQEKKHWAQALRRVDEFLTMLL